MSELSKEDLRQLAEIAGYEEVQLNGRNVYFHAAGDGRWALYDGLQFWQPHLDIAQAFEVIEGMRKRGCELDIKADQSRDGAQPYGVEFFRMPPDGATGYAIVNTAPMAICLAALKAQEANQ